MFEWLKFWEGPRVVFAVVVIPGLLAALFFLLPFLDRSLERRPWRRPIPVLAVAFVVVGIVYLGARSRIDDRNDPTPSVVQYPEMGPQPAAVPAAGGTPAAAPREAPSSAASIAAAVKPNPGRALFLSQGCAACHGPTPQGTRFAPSLINIEAKFPGDKLPFLLRHPTSKMRAGGMPTVTVNDQQLQQLVAYLSRLQPPSAGSPVTQPATAIRATGVHNAPGAVSTEQPATVATTPPVPLSPLALRGQQIFQRNRCDTCHGIGGLNGTVAAPPLAGTASLLPPDVLENLLRHHTIRMQQGGMPLTDMNTEDMRALVPYIRSMPTPADAK